MENRYKNKYLKCGIFFSNKKKYKSKLGFEKWTKINVQK
jgi:hypothetical protein